MSKNHGSGRPSGTEEKPGCHAVTADESGAAFVVFERDTGTTKLIEIQSIAARNATTAQKFITLGYVTPKGGRVPVRSGQQANDVDQWVTTDHRVVARADKIYMRVEDPLLADLICLSFSIRRLTDEVV